MNSKSSEVPRPTGPLRGLSLADAAGDAEASDSQRIIEGYERFPLSTPDEWGDLAVFVEWAARDLFRRLDDEERAAGHEPW